MPSSEKTTNLKLSKFKPNDCPSWLEDYNSDMAAIDKLLPPGSVLPYAGSNAPAGYLIANGQRVSRTTYANLFAVIGTTYGAGDGSSTFNLPDLQGRFPLGFTRTNGLGTSGGSNTLSLPLGYHGYAKIYHTEGGTREARLFVQPYECNIGASNMSVAVVSETAYCGAALGGTTEQGTYMPPYLALSYIIKT